MRRASHWSGLTALLGALLVVGTVQTAAPSPAEISYLTVNTLPWSTIYLDGKLLGNTPKKRFAISPGEHTLLLKCGPCTEPREREVTFTVEPGESFIDGQYRFAESPPEVVPMPSRNDCALLTIDTTPWSTVSLDGNLLGNSPIESYPIEPGEHALVASCGPCAEPQEHRVRFNAEVGDIVILERHSFETGPEVEKPTPSEKKASMSVFSKPWATIYLDGKLLGNTPKKKLPIESGSHTLLLECGPCTKPQEKTVEFTVESGGHFVFDEVVFSP